MSSHVLSEVERVCDRVGIIREGKIVAVERIKTLKDKMGQIVTIHFDEDFSEDDFRLPGVSKMEADGRTFNSKKAYGISFGIYFGMYFFHILAQLGEKLDFMRYITIFHYWNYRSIFINGVIPWGHIALLIILSAVLFTAGAMVFERKDL